MCNVGLRDSPRCGGVACASTSRCRCAAVGVLRRENLGCSAVPRSQRFERIGVSGRKAKRENEEVRPLCGSFRGKGAGGYAKALVGFLAFAVVLISFCPHVAYAALASDHYGETVYGPIESTWEGEGYTEVCYVAANRYDAAAYACGYTSSQVGAWDLTVRAKLSNQSTGGAFYELADGFYDPNPYDTVATQGGPAPGFWGWAYSIYGEGNLWMNDGYTDTLLNRAKRDVQSILSGESAGGGSGGSVGSDFVLEKVVPYDLYGYFYPYSGGRLNLKDAPQTSNATFSDSWVSLINSALGDEKDVFIIAQPINSASVSNASCLIYAVPHGTWTLRTRVINSNVSSMIVYNTSGNTVTYSSIGINGRFYFDSTTYDGGALSFEKSSGNPNLTINNAANNAAIFGINCNLYGDTFYGGYYLCIQSDGTSNVPQPDPLPDNNWPDPDEPVTPDPPNPDPPSPIGPTAPTLPKPTNPTQPTNVTVTVATPVDDILDAINKVIQELENHCVHLQNKMVECSKYIGEYLGQVRDSILDAFDTNADFNARLHDDLMNYLEELFGWLRDNLNFDLTVTNSGDSADVVDWLKRIYLQDGTGYSNSRPIDITQDYNGFGVWVDGIVSNALPDLTDTNLAPVTSAFDNLDDKFPFSVPSDILRIFQSLDKPAQTPVLTFTMPAVDGIPSYSYVVDLSPYDSAMQTVRTIELVGFVVFLLVWARRSLMTEAVGADD